MLVQGHSLHARRTKPLLENLNMTGNNTRWMKGNDRARIPLANRLMFLLIPARAVVWLRQLYGGGY